MNDLEPVNYCLVCGAKLEQRQAFGCLRPVCPDCGRVHFRDPKVASGVLVVMDGKILLVRRIYVPQQGKWTLPAGFIDAGEDPVDTAVRECLEETGLLISITGLLDVVFSQEHIRGASIVILYRGEVIGGTLAAGDDAGDVGFFGPEELPPIAFLATKRAIEMWRSEL